MEKKIEDYLHLYLKSGIRYYIFTYESITDGFLDQYKQDYPNGEYAPVMRTIDDYNRVLKNGYKIILRPLSSLTDEEKRKADEYYYSIATTENDMQEVVKACAEVVRYHLSLGIDLFGLIEAGLAIDKTKM